MEKDVTVGRQGAGRQQLVDQPEFHMMYSAYKLNKQGDNTQP